MCFNIYLCFLLVFVTLGFQNASADGGQQGTAAGSNFEIGMPGIQCVKGDMGMPGIQGIKGDMGMPGFQGMKGDMGMPGFPGMDGVPGIPGFPGEKGDMGMPGFQGMKGDMGLPGPVGPPGIPGPLGFSFFDHHGNAMAKFGTEKSPAKDTCKFAPANTESGIYHMGPKFQDFEVYCNMATNETCIRRDLTTALHDYNSAKSAFWLSEVGVELKNIYSLTTEQITWLQSRSVSARQTLKYNCLDSVPYNKEKDNVNLSVQLLTWNEVLIGPFPSEKTPFFYSVPPATDFCTKGSSEWQSTIIEVQSSNVYRLPITDMFIKDIRNKNQRMTISHVELCFG